MSSDLKQLKFKTNLWVTKWANSNEKIEEIPVDLPGLINILQSLGFHIRCSEDVCANLEKSIANDNQKGITISLACNHSGQTFRLDKPTSADMCQCVKVQDDNYRDIFWEVTATKPSDNQSGSLLETGSDLVPALSKDLNQVVGDISNYLLKIIDDAQKTYSSEKKMKQRSKSSDNLFKIPSVVVTSSRMSLDALSTGPISSNRTLSTRGSTSELRRFKSHDNTTLDKSCSMDKLNNPEVSSKIISLIKTAHSALTEVLSLNESNLFYCSNDSVFSSSTNFQDVNHVKSLDRLDLGMSSRAASSPAIIRSPLQQQKNAKSKMLQPLAKANSVTSLKKSEEKKDSTSSKPRTISKSSKLYAHVKSTIPKMTRKK